MQSDQEKLAAQKTLPTEPGSAGVWREKFLLPIVLALIALIGTISAALIPVFLSNSTEQQKLSASQTAVALVAETATSVAFDQGKFSAVQTATSVAIDQAKFSAVQTATSAAQASTIYSPTAIVAETPVLVAEHWDLSTYSALPGNVDPRADPQGALERLTNSEVTEEYKVWPKIPFQPQEETGDEVNAVEDVMIISSDAANRAWVQLQKNVTIEVQVEGTAPNRTDALHVTLGGGGGEYRRFPDVMLEPIADAYSRRITSLSTDDYFTLQPGEFEEYHFNFVCKAPGLYGLKVTVPFVYKGKSGIYEVPAVQVLCPQEYSVWFNADTSINFEGAYKWTGSTYVQAP